MKVTIDNIWQDNIKRDWNFYLFAIDYLDCSDEEIWITFKIFNFAINFILNKKFKKDKL